MIRRRVVITGLGAVTPIGNDVRTYWHALLEGKSGVGPITCFDTSAFKVHFAGEVKDFHPEELLNAKEVRRVDRFAQFATGAAHEAVADSGIDFAREAPFPCGVIIGSGVAGLPEFEDGHRTYVHNGTSRVSP